MLYNSQSGRNNRGGLGSAKNRINHRKSLHGKTVNGTPVSTRKSYSDLRTIYRKLFLYRLYISIPSFSLKDFFLRSTTNKMFSAYKAFRSKEYIDNCLDISLTECIFNEERIIKSWSFLNMSKEFISDSDSLKERIIVTKDDIIKANKKIIDAPDVEMEEIYNRNKITLYGKEYNLMPPLEELVDKFSR